MAEFFIGRQGIYDRNLKVVGYEFLYRSGGVAATAEFEDPDQACSEVLLNALVNGGLDKLAGRGLAFLNLSRGFILGVHALPLESKQVVLEVHEKIEPEPDIVNTLREMVESGMTLALDDFIYHPRYEPFLKLARIVKVDVPKLTDGELSENVRTLSGRGLKLLAEKVETHEEFARCNELGFDYFQGFFLSKPQVLSGQRVQSNRANIVRLMLKLFSPEVTFEELANIIRNDVSLSFKVLRLINSAYYSLPRNIDSVEEALVLLGLENIRNLIALVNMARLADKPSELINIAMVRGKMCELLGIELEAVNPQKYFTAGLLSVLDACLDMDMEEVVAQLPLSEELADALLDRSGQLGATLNCTLAFEQTRWDEVWVQGMTPQAIQDSYFGAVSWAEDIITQIQETTRFSRHAF